MRHKDGFLLGSPAVAGRVLPILLILVLATAHDGWAKGFLDISRSLTAKDAMLVANAEGRIVFSKNADVKMVPASTLKIFTTLEAFHYLGQKYRFVTEAYQDDQRNLKVKGFGDPMFTSEVIQGLAAKIAEKTSDVSNIILDDTFFQDSLKIPGVLSSLNPYDAPIGALCANFNTVYFRIDKSRYYESAESQTPLIPFALTKIKRSGSRPGRVVFTHENNEATLYAGYLLHYFLVQRGMLTGDGIRLEKIDDRFDRLLLRFYSPFFLEDICRALLEHSNNFIANQLFIACGAKAFGEPGTLEKAVKAARQYAENQLGIKDWSIVEGSGISRKNRLSAATMNAILYAFRPYYRLMNQKGSLFFKTGTLRGIDTRAGYVRRADGSLWNVVLFLNSSGNSANRLMKQIEKAVNSFDH